MVARCAFCKRAFTLGEWRVQPGKPYPEPKPQFCSNRKGDNPCYDSFFSIPANKEKLDAVFPPAVPPTGTLLHLHPS